MKQIYNSSRTTPKSILMLIFMLMTSICLTAQTGIYTVNGNLNLSSVATTTVQLVDLSGAGTGHDQIAVSGDATIDGTLQVLLDGYTASPNDQFEIMDITGIQSGTFSSISWPASMTGWSIDYGVLNPGKVTIYGPTSILPVELVSFDVKAMSDYNLLTWQSATEINNDYFEVEHSEDGKKFKVVSRVNGSGNSTEINSYSYKDKNLSSGLHYYRLKQVDYDGDYAFSALKVIEREEVSNQITIFPNPTIGIIYFSNPVSHVKVFDTSGKLIMSISQKVEQLDMNHLIPGIYYIEMDRSSDKQTITIIK